MDAQPEDEDQVAEAQVWVDDYPMDHFEQAWEHYVTKDNRLPSCQTPSFVKCMHDKFGSSFKGTFDDYIWWARGGGP